MLNRLVLSLVVIRDITLEIVRFCVPISLILFLVSVTVLVKVRDSAIVFSFSRKVVLLSTRVNDALIVLTLPKTLVVEV